MKAAFFDVDGTLTTRQTQIVLFKLLDREKIFTLSQKLQLLFWYLRYKAGLITDSSALRRKVYRVFNGHTTKAMDGVFRESIDQILKFHLRWSMKPLIDAHKKAGDKIFAISATLSMLCRPICEKFGIEHDYATDLEVENGCYTGGWNGIVYEGPYKKERAQEICREYGLDLSQSAFYTDSISDLPLLESVATPVAVSPDARLRSHARKHGWKIID